MTLLEKKMDAMARCCLAETLADRKAAMDELRELLDGNTEPVHAKPNTLANVIDGVLLDLGVPCHIKGHPYLVTAISVVIENADCINAITGVLYPIVAEKHGTTPSRVERAIRHAIECCWDRGDMDVLAHYFGNTVSINKGKPTNSEFIARVGNVVRMQLGA